MALAISVQYFVNSRARLRVKQQTKKGKPCRLPEIVYHLESKGAYPSRGGSNIWKGGYTRVVGHMFQTENADVE